MSESAKINNLPLEGGTYEIIRNRLTAQSTELSNRLNQLNQARKQVFGAIETRLIATDRINTSNYCIARDIMAIGQHCVFGYNVHIGLRSGIKLSDVFSIYTFQENRFQEEELSLLEDEKFQTDFQNLYRYYKNAYFARFVQLDAFLYMVFHLNEKGEDFKAFKWLIADDKLIYIDNRSDHEVLFPGQHEFLWKRASRDYHRKGDHPHISIKDRVFVETVGGDLTIKLEDNTTDGIGIFREEVEYKDQTLDDAEYYYAELGNLVALKIRPYQEAYRYYVFNEKVQEVQRIDSLEDSGVLLPDNHGLIFANGYYLQTGEYKIFDPDMRNKLFKRRVISPNGEDYLFIFYHDKKGVHVLMHYNIIEQKVHTPIICHGYTLFPEGQLCYFRNEDKPTKHHVIQIWQTPFTDDDTLPSEHKDSFLYKIGNKDIVKAMAECSEVLTLAGKEDTYSDLYHDLVEKSTDTLDSFYWIHEKDAFQLDEPLQQIRETASAAIDEYEKKLTIQSNTKEEINQVKNAAEELFGKIKRGIFESIDEFVELLSGLRSLRGKIIGLKELRYTDLELVKVLEERTIENIHQLSDACVHFLLQEDALQPYLNKINTREQELDSVQTAKQAGELQAQINQIGQELEMLIEIVSNLQIDDATQTTRIIESISALFAELNQLKAAVKRRQNELLNVESSAEFNAQLKLLDQSTFNFLDVSDSPAKSDEYLSKLMVQLEELEGKFIEIQAFVEKISEKREEIYAAFETKKTTLIEALNNRTYALQNAADRILDGIQKRIDTFRKQETINSFFASDVLVSKVHDIIEKLNTLEDSNKANRIQTRLKSLREEAVRQLRDRKDLFVDGTNIIQLGRHKFSVNVQPLELTTVQENGQMKFHLTGTHFYETIQHTELLHTKSVWKQKLISENEQVSRAEFLAYQIFTGTQHSALQKEDQLSAFVQQYASKKYLEGYVKGVHDADSTIILSTLMDLSEKMGLLSFPPDVRACAKFFWNYFIESEQKELLNKQLKSAGIILNVFPKTKEFNFLIREIETLVLQFIEETSLFSITIAKPAAIYLFKELSTSDQFVISGEAAQFHETFLKKLRSKNSKKRYNDSIKVLQDNTIEKYRVILKWVEASSGQSNGVANSPLLQEVAVLLLANDFEDERVLNEKTVVTLKNFQSNHPVIQDGRYRLDYHHFIKKMEHYHAEVVPLFQQFTSLKKQLSQQYREELFLDEFQPSVLSSFVRNKLIDQLYLPIFGDNLAKQIGTAGEETRTDRMGLLLLISPPGYGKTTLMEYIAHRMGLIFVKINGPSIGHSVTSLSPEAAPNLAAKKELEKLTLAFEMGDNVMLYVDDIQHCHDEFLQKFISLCDAQRKIEGVYKGKGKTYDFRGRRVCVVMAGNPYTESGTKFSIPDMLANRADIYNLGDIIGQTEDVFKLSYIENALTSNPSLQRLAAKGLKDVYPILKSLETQSLEGLVLESNHSPEEINEYRQVLGKLLQIRDVVLKVNQEYIRSAAMADDYRNEPAFKLQGSYRNMNKLAEKVIPIMNQQELDTMILSHYESEAQTLTSGAESNMLKLKEMLGWLSEDESERWKEIKTTFNKNKILYGLDGQNPISHVIAQMNAFTKGLEGIKEVLEKFGKPSSDSNDKM